MSNSVSETSIAWTEKQYQPNLPLEHQIGELLVSALVHLNEPYASISINNIGMLEVSDISKNFNFLPPVTNSNAETFLNERKPSITAKAKKVSSELKITQMSYAGKKLGWLIVQIVRSKLNGDCSKFINRLANRLKTIIIRDHVRRLTLRRFNKEIMLIGNSKQLCNLESMIESASNSILPVVINGEIGCEFVQVACAIHFSSKRENQPFVEINCALQSVYSDSANPEKWIKQAEGGTLFLNQIDLLDQAIQEQLSVLIEPRCLQRLGATSSSYLSNIRIIASTTQDLTELVKLGKFTYSLYAELNFLRIQVPPLRYRSSDIITQINYLLSTNKGHKKYTMSPKVLTTLTNYDWPGNYIELQQVVAHLCTMIQDSKICSSHIEQFAPHCLVNGRSEQGTPGRKETTRSVQISSQDSEFSNQIMAQRLLADDNSFLKPLHPCLRKALVYIKNNFQEHTTLPILANHACVSPSHLCFLFRTELDTTFKSLLGSIRIEQAKQLLSAGTKTAITEISLDVGFRDLSHFERTFRRLVGLNPREYKRLSCNKTGDFEK